MAHQSRRWLCEALWHGRRPKNRKAISWLVLALAGPSLYGLESERAEFERAGPLPMTSEGLPIDSLQSPQSLLSYVDYQTRIRIHVRPLTLGNRIGDVQFYTPAQTIIPPELAGMLIPVIEKFGAQNMLSAYKLGARSEVRDLASYEQSVIARAITASGTVVPPDFWGPKADLADVLEKAAHEETREGGNYPANTEMILQNKDWKDKPEVDDFVMEKLDAIDKPNGVYLQLWRYTLASTNPKLQARAADIAKQLLASNATGESAITINQRVNEAILDSLNDPNDACIGLFPFWASSRVAYIRDHPPSKNYDPNSEVEVVQEICTVLNAHPEAIANLPVSDGVRIFTDFLATQPNFPAAYDYLAALMGDKKAFQEMAKITDPASERTNPTEYTLNGFTETEGGEARCYAEELIHRTAYQGAGDKKTGILAHLDSATYSDGKWTVSDPQYQPPAAAAPPAPVARVSIPPAPAQITAPAPGPMAPAPVAPPPSTPTSVPIVTATVITSTTIKSRTPSGGTASIPLSVGTKLTIVSVNADGTVKAKTDFNFEGTVPKASLDIVDDKGR